jgi:hypothetical protein
MISGASVSLRPSGIGRYFGAAFLSVWLVGWAVGEVIAIALLGGILGALVGFFSEPLSWTKDIVSSGGAAFAILFLLLWLTLWTIGGIAALTQVTRSLVGEDRLGLNDAGFEVVHRAGPFRRRHTFERSAITRLRVRPHDKAIVVDTHRGMHVLTTFGRPDERDAVAAWLSRHLALPETADKTGAPPSTWETRTEGDSTHLTKIRPRARYIRSAILWGLAAIPAFAWYLSLNGDGSAGSIPALIVSALLACGAALSTWARFEWTLRPGELTYSRHFVLWNSERTFRSATLDVTHHTDSDNDSHYALVVSDAEGKKTMHSQLHDPGEVIDLAHWTAARTGFPLTSAAVLGIPPKTH